MSALAYSRIVAALLTAGSLVAACGGVDKGAINIVDDQDGGSDNGSGGEGGSAPGGGGDGQGGEAGEGVVPVLPEPPVVVSITPDDGATDAEPLGSIRIAFSEGLDPESVNSDSVLVYDGETPLSGTVDYSGVTAAFTPDQRLDLLGEYSVVVTTAITDAGGTAMVEDFSSSFTVRDGEWREELVVQNAAGDLHRTLVSPVIDGNGNALVIWGQEKAGESAVSVFGRLYSPGEGFGEPFEIDQTDAACDDLSVAMNNAGEAVVVWTEVRGGGEEVWARRVNGGELEAAAERVDSGTPQTVERTVSAVSETGEAHVFWTFDDAVGGTNQNMLTNHAAPGQNWLSTPPLIYNYVDTLSPPGVAFDDAGNGFVFFAYDNDTDMLPGRLYARRYLQTSKTWGNGVVIDGSEEVRLYDPPSVVADSEGGAHAVFAASNDVKTVSFSKAGGFSAASTIDTLDTAASSLPKISTNGSKLVVAWYQSVSLTTNAYSAVSEGDGFAPPELRSSGDFPVGYYGNAVSGVDRRGNALVMFEQGNAVDSVDMAFSRLSATSGEWTDGLIVNSLEGEYQDPRLAVAANGVAVGAWSLGIRLSANGIYVTAFE